MAQSVAVKKPMAVALSGQSANDPIAAVTGLREHAESGRSRSVFQSAVSTSYENMTCGGT